MAGAVQRNKIYLPQSAASDGMDYCIIVAVNLFFIQGVWPVFCFLLPRDRRSHSSSQHSSSSNDAALYPDHMLYTAFLI